MRKFIVSDLHGNGEVYDSIIAYLENISLIDDVELYINGDLIDRGFDSFRVLEDTIERINGKGPIKIHYLGGNHELLMYQALVDRYPGRCFDHKSNWMSYGGQPTEGGMAEIDDQIYEQKCKEIKTFLGNLEIYKVFPEIINKNKLVLVHAQVPEDLTVDLRIKDDNKTIEDAVWTRKEKRKNLIFWPGEVIGYNRIGKEGYLAITGHTPVRDKKGFVYYDEENYFNIDGGCALYAMGRFEFDHVPLVEVMDDYLKILIFNHNNEIINGFYFEEIPLRMSDKDLNKERLFINHYFDNNGLKNKEKIKELLEDTR